MFPSQLSYADHIDATEREVGLLAAAVGAGPLDAVVPTCPDWTVRDLADHVGGFLGFWTHVVCEGTGAAKTPAPPMPDGDQAAVAAWLDDLGGHLVATLRATPADTAVWTWVEEHKDATFPARRAAHELAVHRIDAQSARDTVTPIDAALAADGVEEIFVMLAARGAGEPEAATGQTIHLHGTDEGRTDEWLLTLAPEGLGIERAHAKGDLALRGAISDLELLLYHRPPLGPIERFGDEGALDAWYRTFTFG